MAATALETALGTQGKPRTHVYVRTDVRAETWRRFKREAHRRGLSAAVLNALLIEQYLRKPFPLELRID